MQTAVDLHGGDFAPQAVIEGVRIALKRGFIKPQELVIIGTEMLLSGANSLVPPENRIICEDVVLMGEKVSSILRKEKSSIHMGVAGLASRKYDAFFSAGNTAAMVALGITHLGKIKGPVKPALSAPIPNALGPCFLIDVGANITCDAQDLLNFAIMGKIYLQTVWNVQVPKIGLLNIGGEASKGDKTLHEAHKLLSTRGLKGDFTFIGNIEGDRLLDTDVNIVVCPGINGNEVLKFGEGVVKVISSKLGIFWRIAKFFNSFHKKAEYQECGAVPLLGVSGALMIGHGKSHAREIANAIRSSVREARAKVHEALAKEL